METQEEESQPLPKTSRARVLRDMAVFQLKLFTDGMKDLFLSPLSLMAGIIGVVAGGSNPGALLYRVLRGGKRLEDWINLFSAAYPKTHNDSPGNESQPETAVGENAGKTLADSDQLGPADFDTLVDRLQATLLDPDARNRLSERSRRQLDSIAAKLRRESQ